MTCSPFSFASSPGSSLRLSGGERCFYSRREIECGMTSKSPFDDEAAGYDDAFTASEIGQYARARFWRQADALFPEGARLLELGGGTGEDACHFAARGMRVVLTDASAGMVQAAHAKATARGLDARIVAQALDMARLGDAEIAATLGTFDGAYSNFGAVNCVEDLRGLSRGLAEALAPGAPLLLCVMGPLVPWEWGWFLARGQFGKAFRRLGRDGTAWRGLRVRYPGPKRLAAAFSEHFTYRGARVVNAFLPPSYAGAAFQRPSRALALLDACDERWQQSGLLARFSDHYLAHFERK